LCVGISHSKSVVTVQRAFRAQYSSQPLPRDLADPKVRIIAAVKNIYAPMLTRVCGKKLNILSMCAVSPAVHTPNISSCSCQKKIFICPVTVNNYIKVGPLVFLL